MNVPAQRLVPRFVVDALAVYRITRLVTSDEITEPLRARVRLWNKHVGYLVRCPYCTSVWAGITAVVARQMAPQLWDPVASALALSAVTCVLEDSIG